MNYQLYYDATQPGIIAGVKCFNADGSYTCIAVDHDSPSYQQYLQWVAEGNTASTESPPPPPPTTEEKIDSMLEAYGLTHEEFMAYQASTVKTAVAAKAEATTQEVPES